MAETRAGRYVRQPGGYEAFIPAPLPPEDLDLTPEIQVLLSSADLALGRLDGIVDVIPDPDRFVLMYVRREAVLSSQIEGTHASLMDVLEFEAQAEQAEARVDVREIRNHVRAMEYGLERLRSLPLSRRLMCEVHAELMRGVRGGEPQMTPGEFRRSQNWIGGASPASARFVPPPPELVGEMFGALENFLHDQAPVPPLIKIALAHAQFETIHPFLDGNGRTGRLLITFWLVEQGILRKPLLHPSVYLKEHRDEYVDRLQGIRDEGGWEAWLSFFLDGIEQVAHEATASASAILSLKDRHESQIRTNLGRRAFNAQRLLDALFRQPVVTGRTVQEMLSISQPTSSGLLRAFVDQGILRELSGRQRYRVYAYQDYLDLFPGRQDRG